MTSKRPNQEITPEFVEFIPKKLERGVVYVSMDHATVSHSCFCGCGVEVITPLSPVSWQLLFDGETISLSPSVGSWDLPCKSHYWIKHNKIIWAGKMTKEQIAEVKRKDASDLMRHFGGEAPKAAVAEPKMSVPQPKKGFWNWVRSLFD